MNFNVSKDVLMPSIIKNPLFLCATLLLLNVFSSLNAHAITCNKVLMNTAERLSPLINSPAEKDTKSIRFFLTADRKGLENLGNFGGFTLPNGTLDIKPVTALEDSKASSITTGEQGLYLPSVKSLPAFKLSNHSVLGKHPQDVVLVFPYGYLVRAKVHKRSFTFFTGETKFYLTDFEPIDRGDWEESRPEKVSTAHLKNSANNIFIAQRAKAQIEFSNTFVSGTSEDQIGIYETQRKMYETFTRMLEEETPLELNTLAEMNAQVGLYVTQIKTFYDSDVSPYPFNGYKTSYQLAPDGVLILAGQYRAATASSPSMRLESTMGPSNNALIHFMPPQYVLEEMRGLINFINSLDENSDLSFVAYAYKTFLSIHPFANGNGRIARALLDYMLIKTGYTPPQSYDKTLAWVHWQSIEELTFNLSQALKQD